MTEETVVCGVCRQSMDRARRWRNLRFTLAMLEMGGATATAVLLFELGVRQASMTALLVTTAATAVSVMLFGGRRAPR